MPSVRPIVYFVSGPQKARQFPLLDNVVIAGRQKNVAIPLTEQYVSRQQLKFELTIDGWIVENLSASAQMRVNDKNFKPGKQILLTTGDCIFVGTETKMLFAESGDDLDEAVKNFYHKNPSSTAKKPASKKTSEKPKPTEKKPSRFKILRGKLNKTNHTKAKPHLQDEADLSPEQLEQLERKKKIRKYTIAGGVYLLAMIVLVIVLAVFKNDGPAESGGKPPQLTKKQIVDAISSELSASPNKIAAQGACNEARVLYNNRNADEQNLYLCVRNYRMFQALRPKTRRAFKPTDEINFYRAKKDLVEKIKEAYEKAIIRENQQNWVEALRAFDYVLRIVPPNNDDPEVEKVIVENVRQHTRYIGRMMEKQKKRR